MIEPLDRPAQDSQEAMTAANSLSDGDTEDSLSNDFADPRQDQPSGMEEAGEPAAEGDVTFVHSRSCPGFAHSTINLDSPPDPALKTLSKRNASASPPKKSSRTGSSKKHSSGNRGGPSAKNDTNTPSKRGPGNLGAQGRNSSDRASEGNSVSTTTNYHSCAHLHPNLLPQVR